MNSFFNQHFGIVLEYIDQIPLAPERTSVLGHHKILIHRQKSKSVSKRRKTSPLCNKEKVNLQHKPKEHFLPHWAYGSTQSSEVFRTEKKGLELDDNHTIQQSS
ncbi:hypothetical protein NPIL_190541 [Nephila pilipes]|uniref:Uncharacterized protein n=1 Tax=Nephila pilipes TaxID=299642 RepID=A0A8X6PNB6_NEPPI|nr:hypothetical protein NPIL_190541 [Nephila pilipes]